MPGARDIDPPSRPIRDPAEAVLDAIEPKELTDAMFAAVVAQVPLYAPIVGTPMEAEVRDHAATHVTHTLDALRRGRAPTATELRFVAEAAVRRARQHIPLAAMLQTYRVGYGAVWAALRTNSERLGVDPSITLALGGIAMEYFNAISSVLASAYSIEEQRLRVVDLADQRALVDGWVAGDAPPQTTRARFGLDTSERVRVLFCWAEDAADRLQFRDHIAAELADLHGHPVLCAALHDGVAAVLPTAGVDALGTSERLRTFGERIIATFGEARGGLSGEHGVASEVGTAFADARRALKLARRRQPWVALPSVRLFDDLIALADATTRRLVPPWAEALREEDARKRGELAETLEVYLEEDLAVGRTAERLGVHPNTVRYRLSRMEGVTGLSTRSFTDLVEIAIALRLLAAQPR